MFERVHKTIIDKVPAGSRIPGLRLAGADDEAATFAAALAMAIRTALRSWPGRRRAVPRAAPLRRRAGPAWPKAARWPATATRCRSVAAAIGSAREAHRPRRHVPHGAQRPPARLVEAGAALADLRDLVARLLRDANTVGELTDSQRPGSDRRTPAIQLPASARPRLRPARPGLRRPLPSSRWSTGR